MNRTISSLRGSMRWSFAIWLLWTCFPNYGQGAQALQFSFSEASVSGYKTVRKSWPIYDQQLTFGLSGAYEFEPGYVTTNESFGFWLKLDEGNYLIQVAVGASEEEANVTVKAESRRLIVYNHVIPARTTDTLEFMVNIRSARISATDSVRLKSREFAYLNWDENLMLEFAGHRPCVRAIIVEKIAEAPTIFLAGNSTVVDQEHDPWASWGQMFPVFLKPDIAVANFAESGESLKSFIRAGRLDKIASLIKPGDFLFMEFAHNDQKPGGNHVEPYTSYMEYLMKLVDLAREHGATPVLVTSTHRRKFDEHGNIVNTLEAYPEAMRALAKKEGIALIDLHAMSKTLFEALGPEGSKKAFVHYPKGTFPWQPSELADNTHFNPYGAWQLAKCVTEGIRKSIPSLARHLKEELSNYDPASPDPIDQWKWPVSNNGRMSKPDGN